MLSELSTLDQTLVKMLQAFPTLRNTRLDAIHDLATYSGNEWQEDGSLKIAAESITVIPDNYNEEEKDSIKSRRRDLENESGSYRKMAAESLAGDQLFYRSERLKAEYVRDNAETIIRAGNSYRHPFREDAPTGFSTTLPNGSMRNLEAMPDNADPEIVAAFTELCEEIIRFKYPERKFDRIAADYAKRYQTDLDAAKITARRFLVRIKGTDTEKLAQERGDIEKKLAALIAEAEKKGVTLTGTVA